MKIILSIVLLVCSTLFVAQQTKTESITVTENLDKSYKPIMKVANIMLITGSGLIVVGGIIILTDNSKNSGWSVISGSEFIGGLLIASGVIIDLVSIPFYVSAYIKKRKFKLSPTITFHQQKITQIPVTNFGIAISF